MNSQAARKFWLIRSSAVTPIVITGLDPVIHAFSGVAEGVDGRNKSGHGDHGAATERPRF